MALFQPSLTLSIKGSSEGEEAVVKLLLDKGVDVDAQGGK
jgi:hypothetical protein